MKKAIVFLIAFIALGAISYGASSVIIRNPNSNWYSYAAEIKTCSLFVKPIGIFTQYDLEMELSGDKYPNSIYDSLEFNYTFHIPENSTIVDSWLWVGDTIVKAMLINRAKASEIYESYVSRRTDPSILTYNYDGTCQLNVYPLFKGGFRRVRISILLPNRFSHESVFTAFDNYILPLTTNNINLFIKSTPEFDFYDKIKVNGKLIDKQLINKVTIYDSTYSHYTIPGWYSNETIQFEFSRKEPSDIYFNLSELDNEKYYQLAVVEDLMKKYQPAKNVLFGYDVDSIMENAVDSRSYLINKVNDILNPQDSFNIIVSGKDNKLIFKSWMPKTEENVDLAIKILNTIAASTETNLHNLMIGINNYVKNEGEKTSVIVLSSDSKFDSYEKSIQEYDLLKDSLNYDVKINIGLIYDYYVSTFNFNNKYYCGSEILAHNIAARTNGSYKKELFSSINNFNVLDYLIDNYSNNTFGINTYISLDDGFTYSDFIIENSDYHIIKCGKLYGDSPLKLNITGFTNNSPFIANLQISNELSQYKYKANRIWAIYNIHNLYKREQCQSVIDEIIRESISNRVISIYTAYLALEPWLMNSSEDIVDTTNIENGDDDDNSPGLSVKDDNLTLTISSFPEPACNNVNFSISGLDESVEVYEAIIYDMQGCIVKNITLTNTNYKNVDIKWDLISDSGNIINSGVYVIIIKTSKGVIKKSFTVVK